MKIGKSGQKVFTTTNKLCDTLAISKMTSGNTKEKRKRDQKMKNRLSEIRWKKGWSQAMLARRAGVARSTICELENGNITNPSLEVAFKICKALNLKVEDVFYME